MFKKLLAGLATVGLALGMIAVTAGPASAHHNTINPVITCTDDYQYKIEWSVTNSETLTETITASSDTSLIPVGTTLGNKETKVFTEIVSSPVTKTLTLSAKWSNNNTASNSAQVKANRDYPECAPNHVPVTICHATPPDTAAQGWEAITIDDDAIVKSGHNEQHSADIIPAFDYWESVDGVWTLKHFAGKNLTTVFSGISGSAILAAGCTYKATPTAPTFTAAVCTGPGSFGDGGYTIPTTLGVRYEVRLNGAGAWTTKTAGNYAAPVGTLIEVRAVAEPGWVTLQGTTTWSYTVANPGACLVEVTPVAPDITTITECGTYGSIVLPTTTGVTYALTAGDGLQGAWEVTATAQSGYTFAGGETTKVFSGDLGEYTECVEPGAPEFVDSVCTAPGVESGGSYWIPSTDGVTYQVKIDDGDWQDATAGEHSVTTFPTTVEIRAVANDGYTIVDYSGPWSHTFESAGECIVETSPVEPTATSIEMCGTYGSLEIPTTTGVVYELTAGDGLQGYWEVTATPAAGYYFTSGLTEEIFSGTLGEYTDCPTPVAPTATPITECGTYGSLDIPTTEGVVYELTAGDGLQGYWEVTATPADGYRFDGDEQSVVFSGNLGTYTDCVTALPVTFTDSLCLAVDVEGVPTNTVVPGEYVIPSVDGVQFSVSLNGGAFADTTAGNYTVADGDTVVVQAHALPGYTLEGDTEWSHTFSVLAPCDNPTLGEVFPAASVTGQTCTESGSINLKITDHVIYEIDGVVSTAATNTLPAGTYTVTAKTDSPEWGIFGQDTWVLTIEPPAGACTALLASTGSVLPLAAGSMAGGLLFLGIAFLVVRRRREV